jgi:lipopolysaccharide export system permease protein
MKVLTRYILIEFLKPFMLAILAFSGVVLVVQVFNEIHMILDYKPSVLVLFKYYSLFIPEFVVQIIPIACLFGVLFSLSMLSKGNELLAMRAGGVNIYLIAVPIFFAGILICVLSIFFSELVLPESKTLKRQIKWAEIEKKPEESANLSRQNLSMIGADGQIYHIGAFDGANATMTDILVLEFDTDSHLKSRLDSQSAKFTNGQWVFFNGYWRVFDQDGDEVSDEPFIQMSLALPEKPADFVKEQKEPEELNLIELLTYIRQLKHNGSDYHKELVHLYLKLAFPFGCIIMSILGVPWGWNMRKYTGVVVSVGICALVAFAYIGGMQIGQHLGEAGLVSPFLSVWIANLAFAIVGPILLIWKNR